VPAGDLWPGVALLLVGVSCLDPDGRSAGHPDSGVAPDTSDAGAASPCRDGVFLDRSGEDRREGDACAGAGVCGQGIVECAAGLLRCSTSAGGSDDRSGAEQCNGLDDDCDGLTDEGEDGGPLDGSCYGGPDGTAGVGECRQGVHRCVAGAWAAQCEGERLPSGERCDGTDDDCDGETDEGFEVGAVCTTGTGACAQDGVVVCSGDGESSECDAEAALLPAEESCNGLDDDCDDVTDEGEDGSPLARGCYGGPEGTEGVGICAGGVEACVDGAWGGECAGEVVPGPADEFCNGLDDDCDGVIDEGSAPEGWSCVPRTGPDGSMLGSPIRAEGRDYDEMQHVVRITRRFLIKQTELTLGELHAEGGLVQSRFGEGRPGGCGGEPCDELPVESITWREAASFCSTLSASEGLRWCYVDPRDGSIYRASAAMARIEPVWRDGLDCEGYRLPTEAEWEHAARAGVITDFPEGDLAEDETACDPICEALGTAGWYCGNAGGRTHAVGTRRPNRLGVYDMHGSVWEWVWDMYTPDADLLPAVNPISQFGEERVIRGGGWDSEAWECRAGERRSLPPHREESNVGFRPVRTLVW